MAEMTQAQRDRLKKSSFAVPGKEKYPVTDRAHARAALQMSHGARSGKEASDSEHAAVHSLVKKKFPDMYREHMGKAHEDDSPMGKLKMGVAEHMHRMPGGRMMKDSDMPGYKG